MYLRVACFGVVKDFANEINRPLDLVGVSDLFAFDHDGRANNPRCSSNVDQEVRLLEASSCSGKDDGGTQFVGEDLWLGVQRKQLRSLWWRV